MASWFHRIAPKLLPGGNKKNVVPAGVWLKCSQCQETLYSKELERNLKVCPRCNFHFRLTLEERLDTLIDEGTFEETDKTVKSKDPLGFVDQKKYKDRLKQNKSKANAEDAVCTGVGEINQVKTSIVLFNFRFMGGSMGSVVGEKITRAIENAISSRIPLLIVSASGGARMQEGVYSLMQMAKTSSALALLAEERIPYISLLTDPTTGGVSASFAMLGDVIFAEPGALIGFAGARVIQETIGQALPEGFQRAEFLLEKGMVDRVVERKDLKEEISSLFNFMTNNTNNKK